MKIVAELENGFMVSISEAEMAKLLGAHSTYSDEYKRHKIKEGSTLNVSEVWDTLQHLKAIASFNDTMIVKYQEQISKLEKIKFPRFMKDEA